MTAKLFAFTLSALLLLSQPSFLPAQNASSPQEWAAVEALSAGTNVQIETKDGKRFKGKLSGATASSLALTTRGNATTNINKDDVRKIYQVSRSGSRGKTAAIGAAVGAGLGAGLALTGLAASGGSDESGKIIANGILIGGGIGAAIGFAFGKSNHRTLVYESN